MKNTFSWLMPFGILLLPASALAQGTIRDANFNWINSVIIATGNIVSNLIPLIIGIALLVFIWGVVKFMMADDDSSRNDGKQKMIWGVVGLFVIISAWGLVYLLQTLVGIQGAVELGNYPKVPAINTGR
jgi:uncharacterized membrane protein YidH (DUF202 family)